MKQVGVDYTKESATAMRWIALLIAPLAATYTILVATGIIPGSSRLTLPLAVGFSIFWLIAAIYYFKYPSESQGQKYARTIMYHALAVVSLVFVAGFSSPIAALYVLLLVITYTYFGKRGFLLSNIGLAIAAVLDSLLSFSGSYHHVVVSNVTTYIAVTMLGLGFIRIMSTQETRRKTLLHSRKQARLQQERLTTIMNNLSDATLSVSKSGIISLYNAACLSLLDLNTNIKGKKISEVLNLVDENGNKVAIQDLLDAATRNVVSDDYSHQYSDGESVRLEVTYAPIRSNYSASKRQEEQGGYIIIMRDVTKQKSLEEERDEFISVVSHELRTPITIAEGTVSNLAVLMDRGVDKVDPDTLSKTVKTAHEQIVYLAKMVNDLSTLSRAERGVLADAESIDVKELVESMYSKYQSEAEARGLKLNLDLGTKLGHVFASKLYLEELLQNFITNAIKYTNEGSVTIIVKQSAGSVDFAIKDTGIGMSRTDQQKVFQKFYRSEDYRIRETSGTGLGLYVSAKLANMLGAKIELKSRVNFGSTFSFSLPQEKK